MSCASIGDALDFFEGMTGSPVEKASLVTHVRQPRGTAPAVRAGTDALHPAHAALVQTSLPTCPGSACARLRLPARMWSISAASPIPLAVKVGAAMDSGWLQGTGHHAESQQPARAADPDPRASARRTLEHNLPRLIQAVRETGQTVLWVCDPMHGNTETTVSGYKTRRLENIRKELELASMCTRPKARAWVACTWR